MNGTLSETQSLISSLKPLIGAVTNPQIIICPPFPSLHSASIWLTDTNIFLGAQDMAPYRKGAYTGDVSAEMLLTVGVTHVILGHSERRQYHAESDAVVNAKLKAALSAGLTPIVCIGETLKERESGQTESVLDEQLTQVLHGVTGEQIERCVLAYEPVWAIGTGKTATPETAQSAHRFIRDKVGSLIGKVAERLPVLYGGSVKGENAGGLLGKPDIDGALVGGASIIANEFAAIVKAA